MPDFASCDACRAALAGLFEPRAGDQPIETYPPFRFDRFMPVPLPAHRCKRALGPPDRAPLFYAFFLIDALRPNPGKNNPLSLGLRDLDSRL